MRKSLPVPRYVDAASIDEGDVIRVVWKLGDVEHTRAGKVAAIHHEAGKRTRMFVTASGNEIARYDPNAGIKLRFTLLAEHEAPQAALFDLETV